MTHSPPKLPLADQFVHPAIYFGVKILTLTASMEAPGSFPEAFLETFPQNEEITQSGYDGCLGNSRKFPGNFPNVYELKRKKKISKSAPCGTRRQSMCHSCAGRLPGRFPIFPGSFPEASRKISGSNTVCDGV